MQNNVEFQRQLAIVLTVGSAVAARALPEQVQDKIIMTLSEAIFPADMVNAGGGPFTLTLCTDALVGIENELITGLYPTLVRVGEFVSTQQMISNLADRHGVELEKAQIIIMITRSIIGQVLSQLTLTTYEYLGKKAVEADTNIGISMVYAPESEEERETLSAGIVRLASLTTKEREDQKAYIRTMAEIEAATAGKKPH